MGFVDNMLRTESIRVVSAVTPMENGHCSSQSGLPRYKRRRVSAVRTFPPGCGRFASRIFAQGAEAVSDDAAGNSMQVRSSHVEEQQLSFDPSNGIESVNVGTEKTLLPEAVEASNIVGTAVPVKASEGKTIDASTNFLKVDASCPLKEKVQRNYPPRRRISAVRDFPPFCGRNAPRIVKGEVPKLPALADARNISDEKPCCEGKPWQEPLRETSEGDGKQLGENFPDANAYNRTLQVNVSHLTGNRVPAEPDGPASKETRNQVEARAAFIKEEMVQLDVRDQSNKYTRECIQNHSNLGGLAAGIGESKGKRNDYVLLKLSKSAFKEKKQQGDNFGGADAEKNSTSSGWAYRGMGTMAALDYKDNRKNSNESGKFKLVRRPRDVGVRLPPSHPSSSSAQGDIRNKVRETLHLFHAICRKLAQEDELKAKGHGNGHRRYDLQAAKILKEKGKYVNTGKPIIGSVPGVEVGEEFQYRVELNIVGVHRPIQGGIDYSNQGGYSLATSIVASGGYDDDTEDKNVLIYMGQGGNMNNAGKEPEDQELTRGNLALKNSREAKKPVRVIRGITNTSDSSYSSGKTYIYDGLYSVEEVWQELGPLGKLVYKFKLVRNPGQPELSWKVVKKSIF